MNCYSAPLAVRSFYAAAVQASGGQSSGGSARGGWRRFLDWAHFRRVLIAFRAATLAASLYSAGYAAGVSYSAKDPEGTRKEQLLAVIRNMGAVNEDGTPKLLAMSSQEVAAVRQVFPKVLRAARAELAELKAELEKKMQTDKSSAQEFADEMKQLESARVQLENWREDGFLVLDDDTPNAFVHQFVPRVIFVHKGLFWRQALAQLDQPPRVGTQVTVLKAGNVWEWVEIKRVLSASEVVIRCADGSERQCAVSELRGVEKREGVVQSNEQLGLLLGHELSHVIHNHEDDRAAVLATAAGCQLVLLALLDPTGVLALVADFCTGLLAHFAVYMPTSRQNELEADATGLRIAARAGFDPCLAPRLFDRMAAHEEENSRHTGRVVPSWASTHPRSADRAAALMEAVHGASELFERSLAEQAVQEAFTSFNSSRSGGLSRFFRPR